jgi:nucleoside-diphosphate-sugar epimerase
MTDKKSVFIIGGTGFLGCHAAREFVKRGWIVTVMGLPPAPPDHLFPPSVRVILGDFDKTPPEILSACFVGHAALVFAAGMDDRVAHKKPAYPKFHHANVEACKRILTIAKESGIEKAVLLGSYFAYFNKKWPELKLAQRHPYIRSRVEQENLCAEVPGLSTCVLELPYIFGDTLGKRPMWAPLVKYVRASPIIFYPRGGTACITAETVAQAIVGAVERGQPGKCYPIGDENLPWEELLRRLALVDGRRILVVTLPTWITKAGLLAVWILHMLQRIESGLDLRYFAELQTTETYIEPQPSKDELGYEIGGLDHALRKMVDACE